jgi:hypothetical protein
MDLSILRILRERAGTDVPAVLLYEGLPPTPDPEPVRSDARALETAPAFVAAWLDTRPDRRDAGRLMARGTCPRGHRDPRAFRFDFLTPTWGGGDKIDAL